MDYQREIILPKRTRNTATTLVRKYVWNTSDPLEHFLTMTYAAIKVSGRL